MRLFLLSTTLLACSLATATTYTVDNDNPGAADFDSLSVAIAAASPGDTLLLAGSTATYGDVTIDKELHLVGPGYFHTSNFPDAVPQPGAIISSITIETADGSGSSLRSLQVASITLKVASNLLLERIAPTSESNTTYLLYNDVHDLTIRQCYKIAIQGGSTSNPSTNFKILNNVIVFGFNVTAPNSQVENNIFSGTNISATSVTFRYNILAPAKNSRITLTNCLAEYNIADAANTSSSPDWPGTTNLNDVDATTLFVGGELAKGFQLSPASPALNIDGLGNDAGIFNGDHPYVISGMPSVPVIYSVTAPATVEAGETFTLSFKATAEPNTESDIIFTD